ncbi:MAG: sigma-70 family RNA polymerase sigma factor [Bacteroidota bacterium]|nr:sigma-70 family RNA polymerase sigma factor [Bacteroidota bacterium]
MALSYYSDELIVDTIRKNDSQNNSNDCNDVLKFVYNSYYPVIKKLVTANNGNETEAQDIFQETIITFYEQVKKENFKLSCSLKTYLYSISRNLWLKRLGKIKRIVYNINDFEDFINMENNKDSIANEEILLAMINKLDKNCRQILIYYYYDRMRMNDIKDKMNLGSEQSAKNKKYKCMKHLIEVIKSNKKHSMILKENL